MQPGTTQIRRVVPVVPGGPPSDNGTTRTTPCRQVVRGYAHEIPSCKQLLVSVGTTGTTGTTDLHAGDDREERAAIIEYDAGIPRIWADGFARLDSMRAGSDFCREEWEQVLNDSGRFLDGWVKRALLLGWTVDDVFGVDTGDDPNHRGRAGLVFVIAGGEVVDLLDRGARIRRPDGTAIGYVRGARANPRAISSILDNGPACRTRTWEPLTERDRATSREAGSTSPSN
jgi:hypothetical protein